MAKAGAVGATEERLALAAQVARQREKGLTHSEVAERLGLSRSYAAELWSDPDGSKSRARKDSYSVPCPQCGAPMSGSNGRTGLPKLCETCAAVAIHESRVWTREEIVAALQEFGRVMGRAPSANDSSQGLTPSARRRFSAERIADIERGRALVPHFPGPATVVREFGSWNAGLIAAGFDLNATGEPSHHGPRRRGKGIERRQAILVLLRGGPMNIREIADGIGVPDARYLIRPLVRAGSVEIVGGSGIRGIPNVYKLPG